MRWLTGFIVFGIAYAIMVSAFFVKNWPTLEQPRLYGTLEQQLAVDSRSAVISIEKNPRTGTQGQRYVMSQSGSLAEGSLSWKVIVPNGDTIVFDQTTSEDLAKKVAEEYVGLLQARVDRLDKDLKVQMFFVIVIPITLLILFAFLSRWIWNRIPKMG
ncbi:MAG: hypothetical protein HOL98_00050 [Gammaproteobacteria bacterium]|jgi:hypothetical protein|nr:hypothetical protein [Gammaproteobacteria bacterium]MBT5603365.1 hypothetical protein [Gammaproteobacteria bacterium]MBT6245384.1 hypothetical protein [Gammaproteobacteria bacterium]